MRKHLQLTCLFLSLCPGVSCTGVWANEFLDNLDISVSAGYGQRSNPLLNADDIKTYINIDISWYGERFFFDNGDVGYNLHYGEKLSLNFVGQLNNERVFFGKTNTQVVSVGDVFGSAEAYSGDAIDDPTDGEPTPEPEPELSEYEVADRDYAYEAGVEAIYETDWGQLQFNLLQDISGQHGGQRAELGFSRHFLHERWFIQPSIGLSWKSGSLADYYFGVEADESNTVVPEYSLGSTTNVYGRMLFGFAIKKDLFWGTAFEYERLGEEIAASPIITRDEVITFYSGVKYRF